MAVPRKSEIGASSGGHGSANPEPSPIFDPVSAAGLTVSPSLGDAWVIVELAPDAIFVIDEHGHIVLANRAAESMFGYGRETLVSLGVDALVPDNRRHAHRGQRAAYHAAPRRRPIGLDLDIWARRADGTEFPVEISLSPVTFGDGARVVAIVREETARRANEQAARERLILADEERVAGDLQNRVIKRLFAAGMGIQSILGRVDQEVAQHLVD